jgi:hypothetical protein
MWSWDLLLVERDVCANQLIAANAGERVDVGPRGVEAGVEARHLTVGLQTRRGAALLLELEAPRPDPTRNASPSTTPETTPSGSASPLLPATCDLKVGEAGVVPVEKQADAPEELTFCPALLNNGKPLTGPFTATGQIIGPADLYRNLIIVNKADADTCDAYGNKPAPGYFYARGMTITTAGRWTFRDGLGYDEAVTIARTYELIGAPEASINAIKNDPIIWAKTHGGNDGDYPGMKSLPADAHTVATFRQPPGRYHGKGSPCKNT